MTPLLFEPKGANTKAQSVNVNHSLPQVLVASNELLHIKTLHVQENKYSKE